MKTHENQTEFFLLNKGNAKKHHGLVWKFHTYLQLFEMFHGFSANISYQYQRKNKDYLAPKSNDFDASIVITARSLRETTFPNALFKVNYDFAAGVGQEWPVIPQLSLFYCDYHLFSLICRNAQS